MLLGMSKIGAGILAATLTLGGGSALAASAHHALAAKPAPNGAARQAACQQYQAQLAQNLNIPLQQLQDAQKQTKNQAIDARLAAGSITADQAQKAHDRINAGTGACSAPAATGTRRAALADIRGSEVSAITTLLHIDKKTLVQELRSGKSLAQVASDHHADRDTLKATMRAALKSDLDTRVQNGKITQAQEDKALAWFDQRVDTVIDRVRQAQK